MLDNTTLTSLYGENFNKEEETKRYNALLSSFNSTFNEQSTAVLSASGRTEIGGNHTDHNLGLVLGASINLDSLSAVKKTNDNSVVFYSEGFSPITLSLNDLSIKEEEKNSTYSLIRGIANGFKERGYKYGGFLSYVTSKVLRGSGLSSSASIEVLIGEIFNALYNDGKISALEIAQIGQEAENNYFGKPSGLLDQLSSAYGGLVKIDFKDNKNPVIEKIEYDFIKKGYALIITDTKGSHADLTPEYSAIPLEMKSVAAFFGKKNLREVDKTEFIASIPLLRKSLNDDRAILRSYHYYNENERVIKMADALKKDDFDSFLSLVNESGLSSFRFLQNVFPVSDAKIQGLSIALALSENILKDKGVSRVHGGGFAGTIQSYVPLNMKEDYIKEMDRVFGAGSAVEIAIRQTRSTRVL